MKNKEKGFTLIELLAVIVVLALIMIIAIPSILKTLNQSKKEAFYLYAESLQSKAIAQYTQDLDFNKERINCAIYDIKKDLGLSNTGSFDGWVKVQRQQINSGSRTVNIKIQNTKELQNIKYCISKDNINSCKPNEAYYVPNGTTNATITKSINPGEALCVNYQIPDESKVLVLQNTVCQTYNEGISTTDAYDYSVSITLTNNTYSVENVLFNKEMSQEIFYGEIDKFKNTHTNLEIAKPSCEVNATGENKGTTTLKTTYVTTSSQTTRDTTNVTTSSETTRDTTNVTTSSETTKDTEYVTSNEQTSKDTTNVGTTTTTPKDTSLLLSNLYVSGYNINFNTQTFAYKLFVPYETTSLNINATPVNPSSQVSISNDSKNLRVGENVIVIEVFATETGKRGYYRLNVTRYDSANNNNTNPTTTPSTSKPSSEEGLPDPTLEESDATLSLLSISGYNLDFRSDVNEYTLETRGEDEIYPYYLTSAKTATVSVSGASNLSDGSEVILYVKSPNGFYNKTYTITIREKKEDSTGTKVIRGMSIGLGALLIAVLIIISVTKRNKRLIRDRQDDLNDPTRPSSSIVTPTRMENNNPQNVFNSPNTTNNPQNVFDSQNTINNTNNTQNVFDQNNQNNGNNNQWPPF